MKEQIPPQNLTAERAVLGCQMLDGKTVPAVRDIIEPVDFYSDIHATIQRAIVKAYDGNGGAVDALLVAETLGSMGKLAEVGGSIYLVECLEAIPYSAHAAYYAAVVASHARRRTAIAIGQALISDAYDMSKDDEELIQVAHTAAQKMAECLRVKKSSPKPLVDHVHGVINDLEKGVEPTIWVGIPAVDELIGGMAPGELIIIAAGTSQGKSLTAMQILDHAASHGVPSLMVSIEMSAAMLATRELHRISDQPSDRWKGMPDDLRKKTKEHFQKRATVLVAEQCHKIADVERCVERAVQSHGIKIVAVDYCQLVDGDGETVEQQIGDVSWRCKQLATKHGLIVLLLAQLNRGIDSRQDPVPLLKDLRGSGRLEQDSDICLMNMWPWKIDDSYEDRSEYRIYVRKNRSRGIRESVVLLKIDPERQTIYSAEAQGSMYDQVDGQFK